MRLRTPLVPSASPLSESVDGIKRMEDAGASAVVMHSLFEEHITFERHQFLHHLAHGTESYPDALIYFPEVHELMVGPESYLDEIIQAKSAVSIPVIASLNGSTLGGWTDYAQRIQDAGADALELNIYWIPTDMELSGAEVEQRYLEIVRQVKATISIPVAVKVSPFFSNFGNMAKQLAEKRGERSGPFQSILSTGYRFGVARGRAKYSSEHADGDALTVRWVALLYDRVNADLAATSGIHSARDVVKMLMAGADVTMLCSVLLRRGIDYISAIEKELAEWLEEHEYDSVEQLKGSMSQAKCPDPEAFERAQYVRGIATSWRTSNPV